MKIAREHFLSERQSKCLENIARNHWTSLLERLLNVTTDKGNLISSH